MNHIEALAQKVVINLASEIDPRRVLIDVHDTIASHSEGKWHLLPGSAEALIALAEHGCSLRLSTVESPKSVRQVLGLLFNKAPSLKSHLRAGEAHHAKRGESPYDLSILLAEKANLIPKGWRASHWSYSKYPPGIGSRVIVDDQYNLPLSPLLQTNKVAQEIMNHPVLGWTGIPTNHPENDHIGLTPRSVPIIMEAVNEWVSWQQFLLRNI